MRGDKMRVKCVSQCQTDRKTVYECGKEYDIPNELFKSNKDRFVKIEPKKEKGEGQR